VRALPLHAALGRVLYPRLAEAYAAADDQGSFERLLLERIEQNPDELDAHVWLARTLIRQGRIDEGLARLRRVLDRAPGHLPAYAELGRTLLAEKRESEIPKTFEELLGHLPIAQSRLQCKACGTQDTELHWRCRQCGEWDTVS
jgi:lipopolysaccharide biosynthesis regulator YciM